MHGYAINNKVKNHSFCDGNKRRAAALFLWFLANNGILYNPDGSKRIADNTLVALTLMIVESKTEEMDMMVKVVVNLIYLSQLEQLSHSVLGYFYYL